MTDQTANETSQNSTLPVGKILASARAEQGMTTDMVAARLCLTENYIKALEAGNFDLLPGDTFVRGYLRNYADAVGLNGEELVRLYLDQQNLATRQEQDRQSGNTNSSTAKPAVILILIAVLVAIVIAIAMSMGNSPDSADQIRSMAETEQTEKTVEVQVSEPQSESIDLSDSSVVTSSPSNTVETSTNSVTNESDASVELTNSEITSVTEETTVKTQVPAALDLPTQTLEFTFLGDCWYQVIDGTGAKLAERTKGAGESSVLKGVPPFTVTLGDSTVVELLHDGNIVDLSRFHERKSARLKLGR